MRPMKTHDKKPLPDDVESLKKMVLKLQSENQGLQQKLRHVMEQWQLSLQKRFARVRKVYLDKARCLTNLKHRLSLKWMKSLLTKPLRTPVKRHVAQALMFLCRAKTYFTIFLTKIKSAIAVVMTCTVWAKKRAKSSSLFRRPLKYSAMCGRNIAAAHAKSTALKRTLKSHRCR